MTLLGGLVQYGPSPTENWRQAANYLDKILKGSKPADLPIAQPTIIELIINLLAEDARWSKLQLPLANVLSASCCIVPVSFQTIIS
jgi:ABC-type uncharacterized transport system substrate-binding protein